MSSNNDAEHHIYKCSKCGYLFNPDEWHEGGHLLEGITHNPTCYPEIHDFPHCYIAVREICGPAVLNSKEETSPYYIEKRIINSKSVDYVVMNSVTNQPLATFHHSHPLPEKSAIEEISFLLEE